jgi:hypothetical protein
MIVTTIANDEYGAPSVAVLFGPEDVFGTNDGKAIPGVGLSLGFAREVAYRILYLAQLIESGKGEPRVLSELFP